MSRDRPNRPNNAATPVRPNPSYRMTLADELARLLTSEERSSFVRVLLANTDDPDEIEWLNDQLLQEIEP